MLQVKQALPRHFLAPGLEWCRQYGLYGPHYDDYNKKHIGRRLIQFTSYCAICYSGLGDVRFCLTIWSASCSDELSWFSTVGTCRTGPCSEVRHGSCWLRTEREIITAETDVLGRTTNRRLFRLKVMLFIVRPGTKMWVCRAPLFVLGSPC